MKTLDEVDKYEPTNVNVNHNIHVVTLSTSNLVWFNVHIITFVKLEQLDCKEISIVKEVGPLKAKMALSLLKYMEYGIVQFLLYE